jgi:hypothetical protein
MSTRIRLLVLVGANIVLLATLVIGVVVRREGRDGSEPLLTVSASDIATVSLAAGETEAVLERARGGWEIVSADGRFPARSDRVEPFLRELAEARLVRIVTERSELHPEFGVDEAGGRVVRLESADGASTFVFGQPDAAGRGLYARRAGEERVYLSDSEVDFYLDRGELFWAYLRIFPESARPGEVVRMSAAVTASDGVPSSRELELVLDATDGGERWFVGRQGDRTPAVTESVQELARGIVDMVGSGYYVGEWGALTPAGRVAFDLADGRSFRAAIRDAGGVYVIRPDGPAVPGEPYGGLRYTISESTYRGLFPDAESLIETE